MLESARLEGTTLFATGEFSQTSCPCPEKLRTGPVDSVTPAEAGARFALKTRHPLLVFSEGFASDCVTEGALLPDAPPNDCLWLFALAGELELEKLLPGRSVEALPERSCELGVPRE